MKNYEKSGKLGKIRKNQEKSRKIKGIKTSETVLGEMRKGSKKLASTSHKKDFPQFPGLILIFTDFY